MYLVMKYLTKIFLECQTYLVVSNNTKLKGGFVCVVRALL